MLQLESGEAGLNINGAATTAQKNQCPSELQSCLVVPTKEVVTSDHGSLFRGPG